MVFLKIRLQAFEDFHRIIHRGFIHVDLLETARQRAVFFKMLAEFLVGGGTHGAQLTARKRRFQKVGGIHRTAGCRTRTNDCMDFVDEQHSIFVIFQLGNDRLETFLKIAAIAGTGQQKRAHVEREDGGVGQHLGYFTGYDLARQTFGNGGFPHTGVAHQERVVLATAAQHLNAALHLGIAADQRVDIALTRFGVQIDAVFFKRRFLSFRLR